MFQLSKLLCEEYEDGTLENVEVVDGPCFFNGNNDNDMLCVPRNTVSICSDIHTNSEVSINGEEKKYCDDVSIVFDSEMKCSWTKEEEGKLGLCTSSYRLTQNGLSCLDILYFYKGQVI